MRSMNNPPPVYEVDMSSIGLEELQVHCSNCYQGQDPQCLRPSKSYTLEGGNEPLDYIYIYKNEGDPARLIPKHWHYVGFGLSDIHGYGAFYDALLSLQAHDPIFQGEVERRPHLYPPRTLKNINNSGFGIELTFRLKCESTDGWDAEAPKWPAQVMQELAKYTFRSKRVFSIGDHIRWNRSLNPGGKSRIEHMLMTLDPQLDTVTTKRGKVEFIQLVGVCHEELQASLEWDARSILDIMRERDETGGQFLVTDMRRGETIFELDQTYYDRVRESIKRIGSNITSICAKHKFHARKPEWLEMDCQSSINIDDSQPMRNPSRISHESESGLRIENAELSQIRIYDSMYLLFEYKSAQYLPVVLKGRLSRGKNFTFMRLEGDLLIMFIPDRSKLGSFVSQDRPYAKVGPWVQIFVSENLRQAMLDTIGADLDAAPGDLQGQLTLPRNYSWPDHKLHITVVKEIPT